VHLTRRQTYRRRRIAVFGSVALAVMLGLYLPFTLLAPVASAQGSTTPYTAVGNTAARLSWPKFGASAVAAVGYPEALAAGGSSQPLPMASISKIITAMVVLQAKPLAVGETGPTVTFTPANAALTAKYTALDGETKPMRAGASMTELDLMRVALVASANNYAETLTDWAYGSQPAFLAAAKTWLTTNHLDHTSFVEPTGINPANRSTATDLVALGQLALDNPVIASIVSTKTLTLPDIGTVKNTNQLLGDDGVLGIKTGTLNDAGSDLLFAAKHRVGTHEVTIVGAVVGAADRAELYPAVRALLKGVESGFHEITLTSKGQSFAQYSTPWQKTVHAAAAKRATALVWSDTPVKASVTTAEVHFADRGADAGHVTFTTGHAVIRVPLVLDKAIADPGPWWRLANPLVLLDQSK
jgi:D-alanyl-D-alanine carboxypeptidase (penicillin-binding protein 5/6)